MSATLSFSAIPTWVSECVTMLHAKGRGKRCSTYGRGGGRDFQFAGQWSVCVCGCTTGVSHERAPDPVFGIVPLKKLCQLSSRAEHIHSLFVIKT
jgi:hypothetical protein